MDLLAAMPARTVKDYENRLARLRAFPLLVDQTIALLAKGLAKGITPPRVTLRDVPGQITALLTDDPAEEPRPGVLPEDPRSDPRRRPRAGPARGGPDLSGRSGAGPAQAAELSRRHLHPGRPGIDGDERPAGRHGLVRLHRADLTTTDLTPDQIHQLGLAEVARIREEMDAVIAATGFKGSFEEFCTFLRTDPRFFYDKPEDLLAGYRDIAKRIDPELVKLFGKLPRLPYGVTAVPDYDAKSQTTAYYANGSLAAGRPGWFNVNTYNLKARPKWEMEALAAARGGAGAPPPVSRSSRSSASCPSGASADVYPAYRPRAGRSTPRAWASEIGLYKDPYSKFGQLTYEMWRALRLVVDTGLHIQGLDPPAGDRLHRGQRRQARARHRGRGRPLHRLARRGPWPTRSAS